MTTRRYVIQMSATTRCRYYETPRGTLCVKQRLDAASGRWRFVRLEVK